MTLPNFPNAAARNWIAVEYRTKSARDAQKPRYVADNSSQNIFGTVNYCANHIHISDEREPTEVVRQWGHAAYDDNFQEAFRLDLCIDPSTDPLSNSHYNFSLDSGG